MSAPDVHVHATTFLVTVLPLDHIDTDVWSLKVQYAGSDLWAVRWMSTCLSRSGQREYEPIPSEREADWLADHRFPYEEAIRLAIEHAPGIVVNGLTATEVLARINAREGVSS